MRFVLLFCLASGLLFKSMCSAQEQEIFPYQLDIKRGHGFIITHNPTMEYLTQQALEKLEVSFEKNTFGQRPWQQRYGFPRIGASFNYYDFNNPQHLGKGYSLAPYLNFILKSGSSISLRLKTAIGIGYISQPFDPEENFKNIAIGSHFNIFFSVLAESEWKITSKMGLLLGLNFAHFSNTSFQKPNLGINLPTVEAGLYTRWGKAQTQKRATQSFTKTKAHWRLGLGAGVNEVNPPEEKKYLATAFYLSREKTLNLKSSIGGNLDLFYNPAQIRALKSDSIYVNKGWENMQIGLSFYHVFHFGQLESYAQAGYYLKTKNEELGNFYHVVGGRLKLSDHVSAFTAIKTHFAKAEYLLFGINLKLKNE
jgi:hypothetical protein